MNILCKVFLIFTISLSGTLISLNVSAQNHKDVDLEKVFYLIYNQQFEDAQNEITFFSDTSDSLYIEFLDTDLLWWKAICTNEKTEFRKLENYLTEKLNNSPTDPQKEKFCKLFYLNYLLRLTVINKQSLKAIGYFLKINKLVDDIPLDSLDQIQQNIFTIFIAVFKIGKSEFYIFNGKIREENIKVLLGFQDSENLITKTLSLYFLAKTYSEVEKSQQKAKIYYQKLNDLFPDNAIFKSELLKYQ